jgi:hypothetical protein
MYLDCVIGSVVAGFCMLLFFGGVLRASDGVRQ